MDTVVISGSGLWVPDEFVTNEELVEAYNRYAEQFNQMHAQQISAGKIKAKPFSSAEFIEKASGIKRRYTYCKEGILDVERMRPKIPFRPDNELSPSIFLSISSLGRCHTTYGCESPAGVQALDSVWLREAMQA